MGGVLEEPLSSGQCKGQRQGRRRRLGTPEDLLVCPFTEQSVVAAVVDGRRYVGRAGHLYGDNRHRRLMVYWWCDGQENWSDRFAVIPEAAYRPLNRREYREVVYRWPETESDCLTRSNFPHPHVAALKDWVRSGMPPSGAPPAAPTQ